MRTPSLPEWPLTLRTRDGLPFAVRPIRSDDFAREREFIQGLSPESRYQRLLFVMREPSDAFVSQMVHVDYVRTMALVATRAEPPPEQLIAVARYVCDPDGKTAEFAIVVADAWQGRGLATQLVPLLADYARGHGIETLYGLVNATNQRMLKLARELGFTVTSAPDDARLALATLTLRRTCSVAG